MVGRGPRLEQILEGIPDSVATLDRDWCFVYANERFADLVGRTVDDVLGRSLFEVFPGIEDTPTFAGLRRAMDEQRPLTFEVLSPFLHRWLEHRLFPTPQSVTVWTRDITERKEAESERARLLRDISDREERFRALIEHNDDGITMTRADGTVLYASPSATRIGGWRADETTGRSFHGLVHPDDRERFAADRERLLRDPGAVVSGEYRFPHRDGSWLWIRTVQQNLLHHPSVGAIVTNFREVTDWKHTQHTLETLLDVARVTADTTDLQTLLSHVQPRVRAALACDVVVTFGWDATTETFRVAGQNGCPRQHTKALDALTFRPMEPFGGRLADGAVAVDDTTARPPGIVRLCEQFGWTAIIVAPLRLRGRQLGAIAATYAEPGRRIAAWERDLLAGIARQLAVTMERVETHRIEQEAAFVSSALARLGRKLLASFDRPRLLDRVCELTAEAIDCASCVTFLWRSDREAWMPLASYGLSASRTEEIRPIGVRSRAIAPILRRLAEEDVFVGFDVDEEARRAIPKRLLPRPGTALLFSALRRGDRVIGFQVAAQRPIDRPFSSAQQRIARAAAQLTSMALEHARILDQLERANRLKSDFVAMMSHELRTPLHVVLGYGDLLLENAFGELPSEALGVLARMRRSSGELLELVDEMLDLNRLDSGRMPVTLSEVEPAKLVDDVVSRCADVERSPAVELDAICDPNLPPIVTDAAKVGVILKNLIGNALKFTSTGHVTLAIAPRDDGLELTVQDTGIGIAPEQMPFIFEPFRQGDSTMTRRYGGVGLGLYIVNRMVDALGGTIAVDSEPGRGSTFRVWIPDGRRSTLEQRGRLRTLLASTAGEAAIVDATGTIVDVNDRWLAFAREHGVGHTDRLGVGTDYFAVCARACGPDADTASAASSGLRAVLDGARDHFTLDYVSTSQGERARYRLQVTALDGPVRHALVTHLQLDAAPDALA